MAKLFSEIDESITDFVLRQPMFFVATAPSGDGGHVNLSPKGLDGSFAVLGPHEVAYLDLTGSGVETIAHVRQNGRITIMFCAFDGPPRIVRFHGQGEVLPADSPGFEELAPLFKLRPGARSIIRVAVDRVADSCGFGVPRMAYQRDRDELVRWANRQGPDGLVEYRSTRNAASIDGIPGVDRT